MGVFTLGHSTRPTSDFLEKLRENNISLVIDIRSKPYSRWVPQYNKNQLSQTLVDNKIRYLFRGDNLGGIKANNGFDKAIEEVVLLSKTDNLVLLCSEGDYKKCHRYTAVAPALEKKGAVVQHLVWEKTATKCRKIDD
ncbi:MAG: DUF488 family protein [Patescibacteria group bacterium]|jgi:uncharacterized protein (DUF488 family)